MDYDFDYATEETENIVVSACQAFLDEEDDTCCAYYLRIENNSDSKIQLLSKEFNITDDRGHSYCDSTPGFKGELPALEPGEYFEYSDSAPLHSAFGVLYGSCQIREDGADKIKNVRIPAVSLTGHLVKDCILN